MNIIPVIFAFSWIFTEKQWILLQSTSFRSFLLSPEYFLTTNMNGALLNIIPVIFAFSWIFPEKKYGCIFNQLHSGHVCLFLNISWQKIQTMLYWTPFRSFLLSPECFLTKNMDNASLSFIQVIFAVWIFLIDIASIKFIFAFSWIFHEKNVVHSSHKQ